MTPSAHGQCWVQVSPCCSAWPACRVLAVAADVAGVGLGGGVAEGPQERQRPGSEEQHARSGRRTPAASAARALAGSAAARMVSEDRDDMPSAYRRRGAPAARAAGTTRRPAVRGRRTSPACRAAIPTCAARLGCCACRPELSVVVPMYDEEDVLPLLVERLRPAAGRRSASRTRCWRSTTAARDATPVLLQRDRRTWPQLRVRPAAGQRRAPGGDLGRASPAPGATSSPPSTPTCRTRPR